MEDILLTITLPAHLPTKRHIDVFFERAVESLAKQTYKNFKLIIVLNGVWNYENSVKEIREKCNIKYNDE